MAALRAASALPRSLLLALSLQSCTGPGGRGMGGQREMRDGHRGASERVDAWRLAAGGWRAWQSRLCVVVRARVHTQLLLVTCRVGRPTKDCTRVAVRLDGDGEKLKLSPARGRRADTAPSRASPAIAPLRLSPPGLAWARARRARRSPAATRWRPSLVHLRPSPEQPGAFRPPRMARNPPHHPSVPGQPVGRPQPAARRQRGSRRCRPAGFPGRCRRASGGALGGQRCAGGRPRRTRRQHRGRR